MIRDATEEPARPGTEAEGQGAEPAAPEAEPRIWRASETLPPRVRRLRDEYFSFGERAYFRNEVIPYTTGTSWDSVWSPHNWGVVPEVYPFMPAFESSLLALAKGIELPEGFWAEPLVVRRALFFREILRRHLPVKILEGELIVGSHFNTALSRSHTRAEAKRFRRATRKWLGEAKLLNELGVGNCGAIPGHLIPDYPRVLKEGFRGIHRRLGGLLAEASVTRKDLLRAMIICCDAVRDFARRYAEEAERLADEAESAEDARTPEGAASDGGARSAASTEAAPERVGELRQIARICRRVPWEPAETFWEAVQAVWFTHMLVMAAESYPGAGLSHGRFDQYMFPYYRADMAGGRITRERALEILQCYWIKHNYAYDYQGRIGSNQGINSGFGQLMTLGGLGPDGEDRSNELTWLLLDVIEAMNLLEPKPNVRLHRKTPDDLLMRVCGMVAGSQGAPFLLNFDENAMKGLAWQGLPEEEIWDYAPVGCLENTLQGCDRSGTVDANLNLAKAVELALNDGRDLATGTQIGPRTGDPVRFPDFDAFLSAYKSQLAAIMDRLMECTDRADALRAAFEPTPYLSLLVKGCAESGKDVTQGGARHGYLTVEGIALATAVDSLAAVKKLVFQERRVAMAELLDALKGNFEGKEPLRQLLLNKAPKYGRDDDGADEIAREVSRFWTEYVFGRRSPATGRRYRGGYLSWNYWISYAPSTAATPDGRRRGGFLSNGICPTNGADREGPTAMTRSVGKLDLETAPNGASHTLSLSPVLLRDEEHLRKLAAFLRAYGEEGGTAIQINLVDADTLKRARKEPERYRNLLVRVTGYNAYFVTLGAEIQREIIAREAGRL
jgi:formate C-acetyltransferase